jgi:DNA-binding transcriptional MerR regulator
MAGKTEYSIAAVSKLTGVSCHALRVWERRYGFPIPHRSPSGHRRYRPEQVQTLRELASRLQQGHSIGDLIADLRAGRLELTAPAAPPNGAAAVGADTGWLERLLAGDLPGADAQFERLAAGMTPCELLIRVIEPALVDIGERWYRGDCQIYQERCASGFIRGKLARLIDRARQSNTQARHLILIGTVQGDRHEGGALMLTLMLELAGWRAVCLGVDLPAREYLKAVEQWRPDAVALSFVLSRNIRKRFQELSRIKAVPVFVGGRSILNYQGLARQHGLIPLTGSVVTALSHLFERHRKWAEGRGVESETR